MDKRLRSSLQTSAEEFLSSAVKLPLKSSKPTIKTLINTLINSSSSLTSTLPLSLINSISHSTSRFRSLSDSSFTTSPGTPPAKRVRKSARNKRSDQVSPSKDSGHERQIIAEKLQVYAYILRLCVFHPKSVFSASDLLPAAQKLHDNLILFESEPVLLSEIANICEEWWKMGLSGKETLITQSLPVILSRSLTLKKRVDVHRVYTLRDAFTLFDYEDVSINDLKNLLIRCVISPLYLKTEDGRKFIAFMFSLSAQLAKEVIAMIKSQIPYGRKSMVEAYGEIIFRAWKAAERECKEDIENGFLQGLIEGAMYSSSEALAASVRRVLGGFVNHRTMDGVEKLIFRLAEPVIFRSLQVANSNVRQNALYLLLDLFPLEDPDATKEVKDTLLEKQFFLLEKLLMDECPDVRVISVEGTCRILHLFWEIIPSSTITKMIVRIFDYMTQDACAEVRLSTVNGVIYMLGNPQSHEVLKVLLPRLGHLILDSTLTVRAAIIDLLLLLNDNRNFQFHKVVSLDALFSTLANDQPSIASEITKLLIPSYFPSKATEEEACKRCITLIKRSPTAGARFCEFAASEGASIRSLTSLFKVLITLTLSSVKLEEEQIEGLLLAASHLCINLANDAYFLSVFKKVLSIEKLKSLFSVACTSRAQASVCNMLSVTPLDSIGDLFEECLGLIKKCNGLSDDIERQTDVRSVHKMIWSYGWFDNMFEVLVEFLQKAAFGCHAQFAIDLEKLDHSGKLRKAKSFSKKSSKSSCSGKRSSKSIKNDFFDDYAIAAGVTWQIQDLLLSDNSREAILGSKRLEHMYIALKIISEASILHSLRYDCMNPSPVSAYTTLTLHMAIQNISIPRSKDLTQASITDLTMDHLLNCTHNLFRGNACKKSGKLHSESKKSSVVVPGCGTNTEESHTGNSLNKQMKVLTAVLKFIVDANTMNFVPTSQKRSLNFTQENLKFLIVVLRKHWIAESQFIEEDQKEIFHCLKSSFTYAAKLLNLVLNTCEVSFPQQAAYDLVNEMFNLIVSVEEFLGYGYAVRFIAVIQEWIPDLILALGSCHLLKQTPDDSVGSVSSSPFSLPSWKNILARMECQELRQSDEEIEMATNSKFPGFKKLIEMIVELLKTNNVVVDAIGNTLLMDSLQALQSKNCSIFLGLLHFVSVKLIRPELGKDWKEFKSMPACLKEIYSKMETGAEDLSDGEDDRRKLLKAREFLEPIWMSCMFEGRKCSME